MLSPHTPPHPTPRHPTPHTARARARAAPSPARRRYIYTRLAGLTRHVLNRADDALLAYLNEEGQSIEPEW
jgi:hypothetical protein